MIALILTVIFGVAAYAAAGNGEWGPAAIGIGIIVIAWISHILGMRDARAWQNRQNWWARGGPDQYRDDR